MHTNQFAKIVVARLKEAKDVLTEKGGIYNPVDDRFKSFNTYAKARGISPIKALDNMLMKHLVSFWEEVERMEADPTYVSSEKWVAEKLGDIINYSLLAEGVIADRRAKLEE